MFGSNSTATTSESTNSGGFLSRLRSSNRPATVKKPIYTTDTSRNTHTPNTTPGTNTIGKKHKQKKTIGKGPAPMSHHKGKPTLGQKAHGATRVLKGKLHNNHREVVAGEKEMQGQSTTGLFGSGKSTSDSRRV